jgi:4'-phosphopantetheinyl transferase
VSVSAVDPSPSSWTSPPHTLTLTSGVAQVWLAPLTSSPTKMEQLRATLSPDEVDRAARFHFRQHRDRFVVARALLRSLLARYLDADPAELRFRYGPHGKPALVPEQDGDLLRFNLSHTADLALVAVAPGCEVGVDVEQLRAAAADLAVARRFFSPPEVRALLGLPRPRQTSTFFTFWTLKEAYLKACGAGLTLGLDHFDVSSVLSGPAILRQADGTAIPGWSLRTLDPGPGYTAALALAGPADHLAYWRWPDW